MCNLRYSQAMARVSRRAREHALVQAARRVIDARGVDRAPVDEVAREAGLNKALLYRSFASKEELYAETLVAYLADLAGRIRAPVAGAGDAALLAEMTRRFVRFSLEFPAFPSLAMQLMREPAAELRERVSDAVLLRLGEAMAACLSLLSATFAAGTETGEFAVGDPDRLANFVYLRCLGLVHLGRFGCGVRVGAQGVPELFPVAAEEIEQQCVADVLASAGWRGPIPRSDDGQEA